MNFKKTCTTTMFNAPPQPPLTRASLNKAISMLGVDFAKAKATIALLGVSTSQAGKMLSNFNSIYSRQMKINFQWIQMSLFALTPSPNLRRLPSSTMTKKEIEIQKALGTLPYKEWMKIHNILFENKWWYFPIPKTMKCNDKTKTKTIDNIEHYPVADGYIDDLQHSMSHNKWSEEHFATEIIAQCYSCMVFMEIDH